MKLGMMAAGVACLFLNGVSLAEPQTARPKDVVLGENPARAQLKIPESIRRLAPSGIGENQLRVVYVIPSNRAPQPQAEERLQQFMINIQRTFADRLELLGYAPKLLSYETEADGTTPKVNVLHIAERDTDLHGDYGSRWGNVLTAISRAGFPVSQTGQTLLVVVEMQVQLPTGGFLESSVFVGGTGDFPSSNGVGMVSADVLPKMAEARMTDDRAYAGLLIPELGPYALVQDVSFPSWEGTTISSVTSSGYGAAMHELGHAFGLWHDFRNDVNFNGNLMGNGLRGVRAAFFPERYPQDDVRLASGSALMLNFSRLFNSKQTHSDANPPRRVAILTEGTAPLEQGLCKLSFTATDEESGLAGVILIREGQVVADMPLQGAQYTGSITTPYYDGSIEEEWQLLALDRDGNVTQSAIERIACAQGNRAPLPFVRLSKTSVAVGEAVTLDATNSFDPDGDAARTKVEWDVDGDGRFDTAPSVNKTYSTKYTKAGVYQVIARVTDGAGGVARSMPIGIRVKAATLPKSIQIDIAPNDRYNIIDVRSKAVIQVAVLSRGQFLAREINVNTARFGPRQAPAVQYMIRDVDRDGTPDLVLTFKIPQTGIGCSDRVAKLQAKTMSGKDLVGQDTIKPIGCRY